MKRVPRLILTATVTLVLSSAPGMAQQGSFDPFRSGAGKRPAHKQGTIATVEFVDAPITTIFKMISDLTGWSIVMSPQVSKQPPRINIWIKNLTADQVLEEIAVLGGLVLERKGNTIKVMMFDEYTTIYGVDKKVIQLKHVIAKDAVKILKPFIEKQKESKILSDETGNRIVLLVPQPLLDSLIKLIKVLDVPLETDMIKIVQLQHREASEVATFLEKFLTESIKGAADSVRTKAGTGALAKGVELTGPGGRYLVQFMAEPKLNVIFIRGLPKDVAKALKVIMELDVPTSIKVIGYEMKYTNARDVYATLKEIIREDERLSRSRQGGAQRLRIAVSEPNNRIIIEGSPKDHQRLARIIATIDKPLSPGTGGIRVYRLENSSAGEVAKVIQDMIEDRTAQGRLAKQERRTDAGAKQQGIHRVAPVPGSGGSSKAPAAEQSQSTEDAKQLSPGDVLPPRVTVASEINAVIIKASAVEHAEFAAIIADLDKPRDQVMIEVSLVTLRTNNSFDLGLELAGARLGDPAKSVETIAFTTFGIGNIDSATGQLTLAGRPPFGLNYALFNSDDFSLVLNALKTVGDVRLMSAPKLLVEDNTEAEISQLNQEPFEVTSQGEETTVTSFGGFVDAGTVLTVTPYVSEHDWIRLVYQINLSSFGNRTAQQLAANLPPPRRETKTHGTVRIPADHTVVLGGLVGTREDEVEDSVPFVSDIPILGELFKNRSRSTIYETVFIFIRPIVLRDPKFKDLLYLSEADILKAKLYHDDSPENPIKMFLPGPEVKKGNTE